MLSHLERKRSPGSVCCPLTAWRCGRKAGSLSALEESGHPAAKVPLSTQSPLPHLSVHSAFSRLQLRTDSEKRSLAESALNWFSESEEKAPRKLEYDSGSLKMEPGAAKWRRERPESCDDPSKVGELKKPVTLGHPGSLKKGKTPPVAVTSPITHTAQSALKVAGEPSDEGPGGPGPSPASLASSQPLTLGRRPARTPLPRAAHPSLQAIPSQGRRAVRCPSCRCGHTNATCLKPRPRCRGGGSLA